MKDIVREKSMSFAIDIVNLYKFLVAEKKEYVMSKQVLRSGTSIGANLREAKNAQSDLDFIHKNSISQKECDETLYWLELLKATDFLSEETFQDLHSKGEELLRIIKSIIITKKSNLKK